MAILFFEGLPRAGKSYEAMATQIIPWLQKGKPVVAYIEGLNHERIAEAAGLPVERVQELLVPLTREDMKPRQVKDANGKMVPTDGTWIEKTQDNALHVFDEAQNWWPNRLRASEALTQFVTEHGHRGITVLLMGQSLKDVLALWRRRVDQKFVFLKLTALGSDKRYRTTIFKGQGDDVFVKVGDRVSKYDPKYFGTYASHVSDDTETETYTDKRVNFLAGGAIRYGAPLVLGLAIWGGMKSWAFFHPPAPAPVKVAAVHQPLASPSAGPVALPAGSVAAPAVQAKAAPAPDTRSPQERYLTDLGTKARIRLSGLIEGHGRTSGIVEWLDGNTRVIERLSLDQLRDLGVAVLLTNGTARLTIGDWVQLATMWPVEAEGRISERRQEMIRPPAEGGLPPSEGGRTIASGTSSPIALQATEPSPEPAAPLQRQPSRFMKTRAISPPLH